MKAFPFEMESLACFRGLAPERVKQQPRIVMRDLKKLVNQFSHSTGMLVEEIASALAEVNLYVSDKRISSGLGMEPADLEEIRLDVYWKMVGELRGADGLLLYNNLYKCVRPALTCFTTPVVESAFTMMNKTTTRFRASLSVQHLSASISAHYRKLYRGDSIQQLTA